jgi:hypothetical protein
MFHQRFMEYGFLESTLELLQQFYLQTKSIAHDCKVFPGDVSVVEKITLLESIGKILFIAPMAICHHLKILSSIPAVNDSLSIFKSMPVLFTSAKNIQHQKHCLMSRFMKQLEMTGMFYSTQKIVAPVMIIGLGSIVFVRQLKLIWRNQKLNVKKIFQALCLYFAYYLRIRDVLLNCMQNLGMRLPSYFLWT